MTEFTKLLAQFRVWIVLLCNAATKCDVFFTLTARNTIQKQVWAAPKSLYKVFFVTNHHIGLIYHSIRQTDLAWMYGQQLSGKPARTPHLTKELS